ncbi:hypothetical protein VDG1235_3822 [Verrucomicrobiia bacterium DG1235]|nr:hypothetical protein VDG1235_3822 [Verrucomicrobiae bacterium DG1235]
MAHTVEWIENGVIWRFFKTVNSNEIKLVHTKFYSDRRCDKVKFQIFDLSDLKTSILFESEIRTAAIFDTGGSRIVPNLRVAFVVSEHSPIRDVERYIEESQKMKTSNTFGVFQDLESAEKWGREGKF